MSNGKAVKRVVFIILMALMLAGCVKAERRTNEGGMKVIRIEGCQYILYIGYTVAGLAHKGDCDNPIHIHNGGTHE
jgi:hypothetical protein